MACRLLIFLLRQDECAWKHAIVLLLCFKRGKHSICGLSKSVFDVSLSRLF